ncbi:cysteine-rich repeat secretory protein 38-like isoform X2 [Neltuma alba]|uniref:cysteine-rich repeat secretory protein 38-like isoform X2 n=1 Tax=Neltuma alba TaxID=207710 RepID=UPI0010A58684|nr:cysteine-rich repeat secretory protein 38-like isoform X2 [Prosopis alba]XP_028768336.1 cysteine-rich repeat secretory protein 38-like isoform X2 [Prosopis alba]
MLLQPIFLSVISFVFWSRWTLHGVVSDPQANLMYTRCSPSANQVVLPNLSIFHENVNATFREIKENIVSENKYLATARKANAENPVSTLFQCRNYISIPDCVACFDVAARQVRKCPPAAQGAGVVFDGCFLRRIHYIIYLTCATTAEESANNNTQKARVFCSHKDRIA